MHNEIFNEQQVQLLPLMKQFQREYYLVGGTAIALYIGHRRSIDFDLFKPSAINHKRNLEKLATSLFPYTITYRVTEQMNLIINDVKVTFFQYVFPIEPTTRHSAFRLPSLIQLAAMKAYALGRRSKWKDYVDHYVLLRDHFTIADISATATQLFGELYSEKMFRTQLCYFDDIDYTEAVEWLIPNPPTNEEIRLALTDYATQDL